MKKMIAICLCFILLLSLCACGSRGKKLTAEEIETELEGIDGTIDIVKGSEKNVKAFTYTMEDISADGLKDRDNFSKAILQISTEITGATIAQIQAGKVFVAMATIYFMLVDNDTSVADLVDMAIHVICDSETLDCHGWKLSATVDSENDSIIFDVKK